MAAGACPHGLRAQDRCYICREINLTASRDEEAARRRRNAARRQTQTPASTVFNTNVLAEGSVVDERYITFNPTDWTFHPSATVVPPHTRVEFIAHDDAIPTDPAGVVLPLTPEMEERVRQIEAYVDGIERAEEMPDVNEEPNDVSDAEFHAQHTQEDDVAF